MLDFSSKHSDSNQAKKTSSNHRASTDSPVSTSSSKRSQDQQPHARHLVVSSPQNSPTASYADRFSSPAHRASTSLTLQDSGKSGHDTVKRTSLEQETQSGDFNSDRGLRLTVPDATAQDSESN
ncbi:hypothetical protein BGW38_004285, partial [Lunasporangiospora selenospora]